MKPRFIGWCRNKQGIFALERVAGIEPARSAWEADRALCNSLIKLYFYYGFGRGFGTLCYRGQKNSPARRLDRYR